MWRWGHAALIGRGVIGMVNGMPRPRRALVIGRRSCRQR
jgi:hypothetical protein